MAASLSFIALYVVLIGVASFFEVPVGRGFSAFQLNLLIRVGSLIAALAAIIGLHGLALPSGASVLAGLGIGLITGIGSILYCFGLNYLPIGVVVTFSNLYLAVTILLGVVVLREPVTALKVAGLGATLAGLLVLSNAPTRYGVHRERIAQKSGLPTRGVAIMGTYVVIVGVGAFLEKPALKGLDPTGLNALMAISMTAIAAIALALGGPRLPRTKHTLEAIAVGALIGAGSVFYFLGLRGLPVSVAAASSNASIVVTVTLSAALLHRPLTFARGGGMALTLFGVTLLGLSAG